MIHVKRLLLLLFSCLFTISCVTDPLNLTNRYLKDENGDVYLVSEGMRLNYYKIIPVSKSQKDLEKFK
jgi:hypothetical protein